MGAHTASLVYCAGQLLASPAGVSGSDLSVATRHLAEPDRAGLCDLAGELDRHAWLQPVDSAPGQPDYRPASLPALALAQPGSRPESGHGRTEQAAAGIPRCQNGAERAAVWLECTLGAREPIRVSHEPELYAAYCELNTLLFSAAPILSKEAALIDFLFHHGSAQSQPLAPAPPPSPVLQKTLDRWVEGQLATVPLHELAQETGFSRYQLIRAFRRHTGLTPQHWQLNQRVNLARDALLQGDELADIAYRLGFADQSHFQRVFKHYTGPGLGTGKQPRRTGSAHTAGSVDVFYCIALGFVHYRSDRASSLATGDTKALAANRTALWAAALPDCHRRAIQCGPTSD
uniref:HTH araC/xylS-type domain-containing protein n=1 Tax=Parastrongyloides trichosuri TaxID=131310 RepID=A0A0N4ZLY7_PARTI